MSGPIDWLRGLFRRMKAVRQRKKPKAPSLHEFVQPKPKIKHKAKRSKKPVKPLHKIKKMARPKGVKPGKREKRPKRKKIRIREKVIKKVIAADIMTKNPILVKPSDPLSYVVRLFSEKDFSGAPVMRDKNLVGIISETDIVKIMGLKDLLSMGSRGLKKLSELKVEDAMHKNPLSVHEYTTLSEIIDLMNRYDVRRVPVLDDKRNVVGIIARSDIVNGISKELLFKILRKRPEEIEKIRLKIETDIDEILKMVHRKGSVSIDKIRERLMLPEDKIEEWGKILEEHGLLEIFYPAIGKPVLRRKLK